MANQQHVEWLLEGVDTWNSLRTEKSFVPDLKGVDIYEKYFDSGLLTDSGWIPLANIDLRGADLSDSRMFCADLKRANLAGANLSGTALSGSDLTGANLTRATVDRAFFLGANYRSAKLSGTNFYKAVLSSKEKSAEQHKINLDDIVDIESLLSNIRKLEICHPDEQLFYRGHSKKEWKLSSSLFRSGLEVHEGKMLTDLMARRPNDFSYATTALAQWSLAQHHELSTRFLDVTKNPLVALFFACEKHSDSDGLFHIFAVPHDSVRSFNSDAIAVVSNFAKLTKEEQDLVLTKGSKQGSLTYDDALRHLYHFIKQEKPYFEERIEIEDLFRAFVVEPQLSSDRLRAQSGAFLTSALHQRFEQGEIIKNGAPSYVYAHYEATVLGGKDYNNGKSEILNQLKSLNITRETLYPGLDESAKAVLNSYRQRLQASENTAPNAE